MGGVTNQRVVIPWTALGNTETIMAFADRIPGIRLEHGQLTSVSGAIHAAIDLFDGSGFGAV
ncbi:DUF1194 domain-containing protein [Microvirga vignae]|uniref:DUF1194 domain-containing protein n=1 Tax=Microvirga vignae TaxID=1225564 RepID=UPI00069A0822